MLKGEMILWQCNGLFGSYRDKKDDKGGYLRSRGYRL